MTPEARIAELTSQIDALEMERRKLVYERGVLRKIVAFTGRACAPETRAKIGAANRGRKPTKAALRKLSIAQRKRLADPEAREALRRAALANAQRRKGVNAIDPLEALIFGGKKKG